MRKKETVLSVCFDFYQYRGGCECKSMSSKYYNDLVKAYKLGFPEKSHANAQAEVKKYYDSIKNLKNEEFEKAVRTKISYWKLRPQTKKKGKYLH